MGTGREAPRRNGRAPRLGRAGWFGVVLFLAFAVPPVGAVVEVETSVDTSAVYIGDIITYRTLITYDDGDSLESMPHGVNLYAFQVRDYRPIRRERTETGRWREGDVYDITAYRPGTYVIPPIPIEYRTASGKSGELTTQPLTITIKSLGVTEGDTLRAIKPPVATPVKVRRWVWYALSGGAFLLFAALGIVLWRKHRTVRVAESSAGPVVVDEIAEFDKIPAFGLIARDEIKELYVLVSEAMRRYMTRRYRIKAMYRTNAELADELVEANVPAADAELLLAFLSRCDLVKFARFVPPEEEIASLIDRAKDLVRATQARSIPTDEPSIESPLAASAPASAPASAQGQAVAAGGAGDSSETDADAEGGI